MKTITTNVFKKAACAFAMAWMATGCVNSPLPAGATAELYTWDSRRIAETTRTALLDETEEAFYTGNFLFGDVHRTNTDLIGLVNAPLILEACELQVCYYAVVFPQDYSVGKWGLIEGHVSLTGLSTAMYHEVKDLPAMEVQARLNELADLILAENVEQRSYVEFLAMDIRRDTNLRDSLRDVGIADEADVLVAQGTQATIMSLINEGVDRTSDLTASKEFVFSDSWDLQVDVDVSSRITSPSYLMICGEFEKSREGYDVDYSNCAVKTDLVEGRFESTLRMTGNTRELLVTIMSLENPNNLQYTVWEREASDAVLRLR